MCAGGLLIGWLPGLRAVEELTQGRTKKIQVYCVHHKGTAGRTTKEGLSVTGQG